MNTINEIIELVDDLNMEAENDSKQDSSSMLRPFNFMSNGDQWCVEFLSYPAINSEDYPDEGETYRDLILRNARAIYSTIKKYRLRDHPLPPCSPARSPGERKVRMLVEMEVMAWADKGVNINEAVVGAHVILQPSLPGWDCEHSKIITAVVIDSE